MKNINEKSVRAEFDAAASKLTKATDALSEAQAELAMAQQNLADHDALADGAKSKPKNWAHDLAELDATVQWSTRRVASRGANVATAQAEFDIASRELALAQMEDRAVAISSFDRQEFIERYAAKLAPIAADAWNELNALTDLEREIATIARGAGIGNSEPRYSVPSMGSGRHAFDGTDLAPAGLTSSVVTEALTVPEDPRMVAYRDQVAAASAEARAAKKELEDAEKAWAKEAPMREAWARFQKAHDNWEAERDRRVRNLETTATMNPEPVFENRASW